MLVFFKRVEFDDYEKFNREVEKLSVDYILFRELNGETFYIAVYYKIIDLRLSLRIVIYIGGGKPIIEYREYDFEGLVSVFLDYIYDETKRQYL